MLGRRSFQPTNLGLIKSHLHKMFRGDVLKTSATVFCLCLAMLYKQGCCSLNGKVPNHLSYQNLTWDPCL